VESPADLRLDYRRTLLPPKKYFLPPREIVLNYSPQTGYSLPPVDAESIVLFGLHACDLAGTCYCFDVREYGGLDGTTAERLREWDNCLFKDHGMVAGGYNFRKGRRERFHYRYQHKYLGFGPVRGSF
jgi:hypothetical protein